MVFIMDVLHSKCIRGVCRLCGEARAIVDGRHPIPKEKFARQIELAFSIVVSDDTPNLHPAFVCKVCEVKLRRWWVKFSRKNMKTAICNIPLASFDQVECDDVCRKATLAAPISLRLADYQAVAHKYDLLPWFMTDGLQIMKMSSDGHPVVFLSIFRTLSWRLAVAGFVVGEDPFHLGIPSELGVDDCGQLCQFVSSRFVCPGNSDFEELVDLKKGPDGQIPIRITPRDVVKDGSIRHKSCKLLVQAELSRCDVCRIHRSDLFSMLSRMKSKKENVVTASSTIPNSSMTMEQLQQKAGDLQAERRSLKRKSAALQDKVAALMESEGVEHKHVMTIDDGNTFPTDSPKLKSQSRV